MKWMVKYYWDGQYDANHALAEDSQFLAKQYRDAWAAKILLRVKLNGLLLDQIVYFRFLHVGGEQEKAQV